MKKTVLQILITSVFFLATFTSSAAPINVSGSITTNTIWTSANTYLLLEDIVVKNGATLTIEAGTLIKGFSNAITPPRLVIAMGAKINAVGTAEQPIVFTSDKAVGQRARADWAGIAICGMAPANFKDGSNNPIQGRLECGTTTDYDFGGSDPNDSSGVMKYVRIEYAGYVCGSNTELNSLTMGGVGAKTVIDHVMVSYGQDDGFEMFGGTVGPKHVISLGSRDDDFDTDNGWSGKAQYGLIIRIDTIADQGDISNAFESDNDAGGSLNTPITGGVISNFTIIGPAATTTSTIDAKYGWVARLRRNTSESILNSVFIGYKRGLRIEGAASQTNATNGDLQFANNIIGGCKESYGETAFDSAYLQNVLTANTIYGGNANDSVKLNYAYGNPDLYNFVPQAGSPALTGASFVSPKLNGFETTAYRGAFGATNWAACWAEFSPQDEIYTAGPINYALTVNINQSGTLPTGVTLTADNISGASYNWSTAEITNAVTVTATGIYAVTVTSARGCEKVVSTNVTTVGINEISTVNTLNIFPNPNNGLATLEISTRASTEVSIQVMDVTGKQLININREFSSGRNQVDINTSTFASGIYFIYVKDNVQSHAVRMVVSK